MQRGLSFLVAAAIVCGGFYFLLSGLVAGGMPEAQVVLMTAAAALALALCGAIFGLLAYRRSSSASTEITRLALSVDAAIRELSSREKPDVASTAKRVSSASRKAEAMPAAARIEPIQQPAPAAPSATIITHPALLRSIQDDKPAEAMDDTAAAIRDALSAGRIELSLQPIISIARGEAAGFDVFAHLPRHGDQPLELRRPENPSSGVPMAAFERLLVASSVQTAIRHLGEASEATPLHVAISEALLEDGAELATVLTLFSQHADDMRSIVLSIPAAVVEGDNDHAQALGLLMQSGVRIAVEGWSGNAESLKQNARGNIAFIKLSARELLDPVNFQKIETLREQAGATGISVIATEVALDDDAVGLIDLGIVLMTGPRFSGPRRVKGGTVARPTRSAHL
ncbi:EAL domain-containing protein [Mesorhizobium sp. CGMCC 1.15528]|uniref:EAL domain-containing protein n=1 Tax=Mesorhizobium zhangyense TaxID=1776730 RepID=A0A7C9VBQ6_9HYPH|nr:EAL domain-containing protein [Mesorhizobium zhangyense]NGN43346.1 EAL domain-containing protein [Mesorhizobium zhangyense]